jgi:hypothetical protein
MDKLLDKMAALTERVEQLEQPRDYPAEPPPYPPGNTNKKHGKHQQPRPPNRASRSEEDDNLLGDPRGSKFVRGERPLSPNESYEFPKS